MLLSQAAFADQLHVVVGVMCTPTQLEVKIERAWNEDGVELLADWYPKRWNTEELRTITSSDEVHYRTKQHRKTVTCKLSGTAVRVVVQPEFALRWHPVGWCATRTGVRVKVYRGGSLLISDGHDVCSEIGDVPISISVSAKGAPAVVRMPATEFIEVQ
ncbi:hypothetical protein GCM10025770_22820 [Viridibacterium curvum]|uniref:Uncharacterized protein n=2 Tax=Viridibacterium curvum TaxID=1101404 RepID=A0ABP9QRH3_9RHOO